MIYRLDATRREAFGRAKAFPPAGLVPQVVPPAMPSLGSPSWSCARR